ncbi:hypothetical protein B7C51_11395 [Paenibacillus larvae subsp. pulvifaciens]|uniref:Uncharacterized protein n=1 Tax=Paenibacillus larvae subsp. pulvifaciens TaxID=1477 RepID=A0A1V0USK7_9BACL|nr:hypothetical protein B7C51_11395 [Paenibacillus larvae subsp. pulvifaciens]
MGPVFYNRVHKDIPIQTPVLRPEDGVAKFYEEMFFGFSRPLPIVVGRGLFYGGKESQKR